MKIKNPNMNKTASNLQSFVPLNESVTSNMIVDFKSTIENFISNFPDNAISWIDATQELTTLALAIAEELNISPPNDKVFTPAENNMKWKSFIINNILKLSKYQEDTILRDFSHWFFNSVFESENLLEELNPTDKNTKALKDLVLTKNSQFKLDCDMFFATINNSKLDNRLSLKWHVKNTLSAEEFIESVRKVVSITDNNLTQNDIERLNAHYNKYSTTI